MKKIIASILTLTLLSVSAFASGRSSHYKAQKPQTAAQATEQFNTNLNKIGEILEANKPAEGQPLETIHEVTYELEAAVEFWAKNKSNKKTLKKLADTLEELHLSSERQQEDAVRTRFVELKKEFEAVQKKIK